MSAQHVQNATSPFQQSFSLITSDGQLINVTMGEVDYLRVYGSRLAINYGSQVGASAILLLVLLLLTRPEKRKSSIFITNALCLVFNTIRSVLFCMYLTGNYWNVYSQLANDISMHTWQDHANSVAANTTTLILVICIMASLSMQVWVVCKTTPTLQRAAIIITSSSLALVAVGFRFAVAVIGNYHVVKSMGMADYDGLVDQMNILQTAAIWGHCAIFTLKLGHALIQRRKLGMTQFGPMQIVFIMGAQTMVIPAIFSILQFSVGVNMVPEIGSQALTVVCVFLPLSAIWAGVVANDRQIAASGVAAHQRLLQEHFGHSTFGHSASSTLLTN